MPWRVRMHARKIPFSPAPTCRCDLGRAPASTASCNVRTPAPLEALQTATNPAFFAGPQLGTSRQKRRPVMLRAIRSSTWPQRDIAADDYSVRALAFAAAGHGGGGEVMEGSMPAAANLHACASLTDSSAHSRETRTAAAARRYSARSSRRAAPVEQPQLAPTSAITTRRYGA
jgi:hypothetical protein